MMEWPVAFAYCFLFYCNYVDIMRDTSRRSASLATFALGFYPVYNMTIILHPHCLHHQNGSRMKSCQTFQTGSGLGRTTGHTVWPPRRAHPISTDRGRVGASGPSSNGLSTQILSLQRLRMVDGRPMNGTIPTGFASLCHPGHPESGESWTHSALKGAGRVSRSRGHSSS